MHAAVGTAAIDARPIEPDESDLLYPPHLSQAACGRVLQKLVQP